MTAVLLGDLPSNAFPPVGVANYKYGTADTAINPWGAAAGSKLLDGTGGPMEFNITPARNCYLYVCGQTLWSNASAAWYRADWAIRISPSDLDGRFWQKSCTMTHSAVPHQTWMTSTLFKVSAGVQYNVYMSLEYLEANGPTYHTHWHWNRLFCRTVGEGTF
jgi:hypothetical protein